MESGYKILETICTVSKKKSTRKLSNVLNLPDLVVDKIFSSVEESYNIYFDLNGPEEISWLFEDQAEEVAEVCYSIISKFYEFMLCIVSPWWRMNKLGFGVMRREICNGWLNNSRSITAVTCGSCEGSALFLSTSLKRSVTQLRSDTEGGNDDEEKRSMHNY